MAEIVYPPVIKAALGLFKGLNLRFHLEGAEQVPAAGGAVLVTNHISYLDFIFAGLAAHPAKRLVRFMAKKEVFDHRISGPLMRGMHHIPVDRSAGADSYQAAVEALRAGEIVGVFAEATISRSFTVKDIKSGAVRMAAAAGVPLIPVALWGTQRMWTKGRPRRLRQRNVPITIIVGEPMRPAEGDDFAAVTAELRERMSALLEKAQREYSELPKPGEEWWQPAYLGGTAPTPEEAAELDRAEKEERAAKATAKATRNPTVAAGDETPGEATTPTADKPTDNPADKPADKPADGAAVKAAGEANTPADGGKTDDATDDATGESRTG